jgi:hypothetical protein
MTDIKLEPCPFCGCEKLAIGGPEGGPIPVACMTCWSSGPTEGAITRFDGINKWNKRSMETMLRERADSATERNKQLLAEIRLMERQHAVAISHQRSMTDEANDLATKWRKRAKRLAKVVVRSERGRSAESARLAVEIDRLKARVPIPCLTCEATGKIHEWISDKTDTTWECVICHGTGAGWKEGK